MSDVATMFSTTVRNDSAVTKSFSFLPPHGRRMAPGERYTFPGDLATVFGGNNKRRQRTAFIRTIESGDLVVLQTPVPQAIDATTGTTYGIGVSNEQVVVISPAGSSEAP